MRTSVVPETLQTHTGAEPEVDCHVHVRLVNHCGIHKISKDRHVGKVKGAVPLLPMRSKSAADPTTKTVVHR